MQRDQHVSCTRQRDEAQRILADQQHAIRRLQDAFEAGALTVEELAERTERVRARIRPAQEELVHAQADLAQTAELKALAGKLTAFAEQVRSGLDALDWKQRQLLIRILVSKVEIDEEGATVVYRIPTTRPPGGPPPPSGPGGGEKCQLHSRREHPVKPQQVQSRPLMFGNSWIGTMPSDL